MPFFGKILTTFLPQKKKPSAMTALRLRYWNPKDERPSNKHLYYTIVQKIRKYCTNEERQSYKQRPVPPAFRSAHGAIC